MTELKRCLCGGEPFVYNPTDTGYEEDYIGDYYCVECENAEESVKHLIQKKKQ